MGSEPEPLLLQDTVQGKRYFLCGQLVEVGDSLVLVQPDGSQIPGDFTLAGGKPELILQPRPATFRSGTLREITSTDRLRWGPNPSRL
ncbi:MAG: hypothetical protein HYR61_18670 [Acidobacteria bacterium]|nr:hypothetical protein [Acidobacteriota bacterium]